MTHRIWGLIVLALLISGQMMAQKVYVLDLRDEIDAPSARYMTRGIAAAKENKADLIVVHLDTYGGRVDHADSIRSSLLDAGIPTAVFIDRNAASAGALISIACDSIFMAPGATIGAATVVNGDDGKAAPDKYQSYWKGIMRTTAEMKDRDPAVAEKMVDQKLEIEGLSPAGQVITFSTSEALENNYCDAELGTITEVINRMGVEQPEIIEYTGSSVDQFINFLISPTVSFILVLLIFGGIFMEMKTPGVGFAGGIAIIAIALFFAPHYIEGLVESWEIALFIVGVILIALEIFVVPGFGVPGILGIIGTVGGIVAALMDNDGPSLIGVSTSEVLEQTAYVLVMMVSAILVVIVLAKRFFKGGEGHPLVDTSAQNKEEGYVAVSREIMEMVGKAGTALTDLRPTGFVEIDGKKMDATIIGGLIDKGEEVKVTKIDGITLIVEKV